MPKGRFLFSAVFGFRNPSKEIFSESDEINAQHPIFPRSFQNTRERPEGGHRPTRRQAGAAKGGPAPPYCVIASSAFRLRLFAYLKVPDLKPRDGKATVQETFQSRRHREAKIWGTGVSVPARRRDGEVPPEGSSIDTSAIFINAAVSHDEGVVLHRGSGMYR